MHIPNHPLFETLKKFSMPTGEYAIFGSGPMWVRGIRESRDIDIIAYGAAWQWATEHGTKKTNMVSGLEYFSLGDGLIEIYNGWYPGVWDIEELIGTADVVDGIRFVRLYSVIEWKRRMGREKDTNDLILLEEYLLKHPESL